MDIRDMQYFLAVAREQSMSGAAEYLHLAQSTLSRQIKELENELGKQLFIRGNRKVTLTEDGMILLNRAEEIVALVKKAEKELMCTESVGGDIHIGSSETDALRFVLRAAKVTAEKYPRIQFHFFRRGFSECYRFVGQGRTGFWDPAGPCQFVRV